ncbi:MULTISPECIES: hypothetical protein [Rhodopseudomonas]|uniref:Uncharacterized protein n=1 Tax=Rhodopseudomonas palustris TaxID=1076 RepID=A0A0D7E2V3_RHOPL|nr:MULTISPECIES: hypothetical protein [Rhodopseudomonas]KIZ34836.1 hypothetical protein OO17_26355 [Rhodopseudomonas palustris]MDF3810696.1 hypothetical protein [Rhodopseudomonas sp. BAL398]WOK18486.1 hypothetical protein RBJ75_02855 [Rhodopseudomonas sp. BAL398]
MEDDFKSALALLGGGAVILAGLSGFAYWLFKLFSEKWLTAKFNERLEAYKHQQIKELEEFRFKISGLLDRTTKLYQREFEVLPEAWSKLVIAHATVESVVSALQQHPDLAQMNPNQLEEFIQKSSLNQWQKDELRSSPSKTKYYQTASNWVRMWDAQELCRDYFVYERRNGIFIRNEIKDAFNAISRLMNDALLEYKFELQFGDTDYRNTLERWAERRKFSKQSKQLLDDVEKIVQQRLWDSQDAFAPSP